MYPVIGGFHGNRSINLSNEPEDSGIICAMFNLRESRNRTRFGDAAARAFGGKWLKRCPNDTNVVDHMNSLVLLC